LTLRPDTVPLLWATAGHLMLTNFGFCSSVAHDQPDLLMIVGTLH
jgi:hypothetical protein